LKIFIEEKSQKSVIFTIYMTLSKLLFDLKSPDVQNNMIGKARTEIACTLSWFGNWSEDQRNEFGKVLQKNENQGNDDASIEALMALVKFAANFTSAALMSTMTQMSLGTASKEGPSIFECQLKIFSKWYGSWSPAETSEFASQLNSIHPEFVASLNSQMLNNLR